MLCKGSRGGFELGMSCEWSAFSVKGNDGIGSVDAGRLKLNWDSCLNELIGLFGLTIGKRG